MKTFSLKLKMPSWLNTKVVLGFVFVAFAQLSTFAQAAAVTTPAAPVEKSSIFTNPVFVILLSIIILLLFVILGFTKVIGIAAHHKAARTVQKNSASENAIKVLAMIFMLGGFAQSGFAQAAVEPVVAAVAEADPTYWGLSVYNFYGMVGIICFELFVAGLMYYTIMRLLGVKERKLAEAAKKAPVKKISFIEKINASVPLDKEADVMMDHDYDGIKELDNNLPPWWKYGFYLTIVVGIIYLFHYHVVGSGKLQIAEYDQQMNDAKKEALIRSKNAANSVDETNAVMLDSKASLASGKSTFDVNCVACHGALGEGGIGPNLTDDYWLHMGDVKDIFKTIKIGYPEKGMKSWAQDLSPRQINEVASYIKSLRGTNPKGAIAPQGELYVEKGKESDSTKVVADSLTKIAK
jgi:cytochrome c oxidase cbb3-type subunit 3